MLPWKLGPPLPQPGPDVHSRGSICLWSLCFVSLLLRAGPRGCHPDHWASPEARGKGKVDHRTVPLPVSDITSSLPTPPPPGDWSHCPALAPPSPAVSHHLFSRAPPAVTLQGRSGCKQQGGGQPGAGSLERAPAVLRHSQTVAPALLSPAQRPPLPGVPDLGSLAAAQWVLETGSIQ